mgnify:CR=1 FL=1
MSQSSHSPGRNGPIALVFNALVVSFMLAPLLAVLGTLLPMLLWRTRTIPYGPYLSLATLVLLLGPFLIGYLLGIGSFHGRMSLTTVLILIPLCAAVMLTTVRHGFLRRLLPVGGEPDFRDPSGTIRVDQIPVPDPWIGHRTIHLQPQGVAVPGDVLQAFNDNDWLVEEESS